MNRPEAVKILQRLQEPEPWEPKISQKCFEALEMAILALNRVSDEDLEAEKKEFLRKSRKNREMSCEKCIFWTKQRFKVERCDHDEEFSEKRPRMMCRNPKSAMYLRQTKSDSSCTNWVDA